MKRITQKLLLAVIIFALWSMCKFPDNPPDDQTTTETFQGDIKDVKRAIQMFEAIGGMDGWANLRSLYIKALHTEPQMDLPYDSEIWRSVDEFKLRIKQGNEKFRVLAEIDENQGKVTYLDQRDTFRLFSAEELSNWKFDNQHNVYVALRELALAPSKFSVKTNKEERLDFFRDSVFYVSFGLDEENRPHLFYHPTSDGKVVGSLFNRWGTDGGLIHSAGGHPLDSNFMYITEIWQPSMKSFDETFDFSEDASRQLN